MKTKILVIEDDASISELICMNLEAAGYETEAIRDGLLAEAYLKDCGENEIALALVDVMLPGKDGFALMEDLQRGKIPVIYLTAKDDVVSKVHGLKAGAEDYIVKPFEVLELLVRIEKVLKRTGRSRQKIQIRDVVIDLKEHSVTKAGEKVALKPLEYELLVTLASSRNVAFSREELLNQIWGCDYMGETRTVDVHIGQLRKKLDFHDVIRTISKTGYRLEDLS
ncbi:MAG: response regulator transcription factor [Lachnospiraceae bacterium]|nr:response regulator transcription factor [Lachnospiraceae bacterium]